MCVLRAGARGGAARVPRPAKPGDALLFTVDLLRIVSGKVMTKEETERL
eukprot:gene18334-26480_t